MASRLTVSLPLLLLTLILLARPSHAFGAGNIGSIAKIEGVNWRHGDIEDTLLALLTARAMGGKKFTKMDVKRVYFGNWLRDYSQAVDVGTVKHVSAEAIRLLLWVLGFMSFGYGTAEFEVTKERLGCYRPEEHIDNPKDYADNEDARQYDQRLRGPVDERKELSIDERIGLKHYIATEGIGITTSAGLVRKLFRRSIELGRQYQHSHDERDFFEALRLLGTGCHCLEDFSAHSNYTELALIEMGERDVFPHVGRRTQMQIPRVGHPVYPIVTGTFGGVDFLHSVMGEFSDKATQSELQELEGTIQNSKRQDTSLLKELLSKLPSALLGNTDHAGKADTLQANAASAQMQNMHISPKKPEAFTQQIDGLARQIYPILEFHDTLIKNITEAIDKIPVLPDLIEQIQEQVNVFVFSLIAPFILPIIDQIKTELSMGSSEVIQSSKDKQLIVFHDDGATDPTHSMLSKDHFSNVLNEPAGKVASQVLKWVVPQIVACWDNPQIDIRRTNDRIIRGIFHHPALKEYGDDGARDGRMAMFGVVEKWWRGLDERERNDLKANLSRDGVMQGRNHKEGVHDSGHGCGKPLGMPNMKTSSSSGAIGGPAAAAMMGGLGEVLSSGGGGGQLGNMLGSGNQQHGYGGRSNSQISNMIGEAAGGGALGSIVGGLAGAVGGDLLGSAFEGNQADTNTFHTARRNPHDGSVTESVVQTGHRPGSGQPERYGQAEMSHTQFAQGGYRDEYARYEQDGHGGRTGYGFEQATEVRPVRGGGGGGERGGFEQRTERKYERPGGTWESEVQVQRVGGGGGQYAHEEVRHGRRGGKDSSDGSSDGGSGDDSEKKERKRRRKEEKRLRKMREEEEKQQQRHRRGSGGGGGGSPNREHSNSGGTGMGRGGGGGGGHMGPGQRARGGPMRGGRGRRGGRDGGHRDRGVESDEFGGAGSWAQEDFSQQSYASGGAYGEQPNYGQTSYGEESYGGANDQSGGYSQSTSYGDNAGDEDGDRRNHGQEGGYEGRGYGEGGFGGGGGWS